jgi:hypothetical protein
VFAGALKLLIVTVTAPACTTLKVPRLDPCTTNDPENVSVVGPVGELVDADGEGVPGGREQPTANIASASAWMVTAFTRIVTLRTDDICIRYCYA